MASDRYPKEWAKWFALTGEAARKRRQQLRQAAEQAVIIDRLKAEGASCGTCDACSPSPCGPRCDFESGGGAYAVVALTGICHRFVPRVTKGKVL